MKFLLAALVLAAISAYSSAQASARSTSKSLDRSSSASSAQPIKPAAQNRQFRCHFTKLFMAIVVNEKDRTLTLTDYEVVDSVQISRRSNSRNVILYRFKSKLFPAQSLSINLARTGSDGMSDKVYAFEGKLRIAGDSRTRIVKGGCEIASKKL